MAGAGDGLELGSGKCASNRGQIGLLDKVGKAGADKASRLYKWFLNHNGGGDLIVVFDDLIQPDVPLNSSRAIAA